ncbi:MAG: asparagine synthase-related protein [Candidatus Aenigmarchaeota archaeon]|nr:asparagine synthase-related protein [Candidatus Aenigmarchaeota archaeon]
MDKTNEIRYAVGEGYAINALSGGVDSSVVTMLGHRALGDRLRTYFIDDGLMRENEANYVSSLFYQIGVPIEVVDSKERFFSALRGIEDPEDKRNAFTDCFYKTFGDIVRNNAGPERKLFLLQGTNYTDVEETLAKVKRQHNVLAQLGIDPLKTYGYDVIEPIIDLRKPAVRAVAREIGLPKEVSERIPFPGPGLAARIIGEVTPGRVETVRKATKVVEQELYDLGAFQYLAILHKDNVTGMRDGKRDFGQQIEVRCWDSKDAVTGAPTKVPFEKLTTIADRITREVPGVVSVTYNITKKPPSTIEAV